MPDQELIDLIQKYLDGTCNSEEQQRVEQWYEQQSAGDMLFYDDDDARLKLLEERSLAIIRKQMQRQKLDIYRSFLFTDSTQSQPGSKPWLAIASHIN